MKSMRNSPLRRFASSPLSCGRGGRTLWPGKAGSTGALVGAPLPEVG
jgi:hypothetical protein